MKAKKNSSKDLNNYRSLFLQVGLILVLTVTWFSFEWTLPIADQSPNISLNTEDEFIPEIPEIKPEEPEIPKEKPKIPEELALVPDDTKAEEPDFLSTEDNQNTAIINYSDIPVAKTDEVVEVDYINVEQIPLFPACVKLDKKEQRTCFQSEMTKHVRKNFSYPPDAIDLQIQGRVYVMFTIDENGRVIDLKLRGPDHRLEAEAQRIIEKLPQFIPGKMGQKNVRVPYSLPINFVLQN